MIHIEEWETNKKFICSNTKKSVFLIGDSIHLGCCAAVWKSPDTMK